jgi:hypothetical protein
MEISRRDAGRIAINFVIEELRQRGYKVLATNSTTLSVLSPNGKPFLAQVTSLSSRNAWIIPNAKDRNSYFVLVYKPENETPVFCVLTSDEMEKEKKDHIRSRKKPINLYSNPELEKMGLNFDPPFHYENNWTSLPE